MYIIHIHIYIYTYICIHIYIYIYTHRKLYFRPRAIRYWAGLAETFVDHQNVRPSVRWKPT